MRKLELRHNNAYDTVLLLDDLVIIGAWTVTPEVKANFDNPGDLNYWEATNVIEHDPEDYGDLEETKYEELTTDQVLEMAEKAVDSVGDDFAVWSEDSPYTASELKAMYFDNVVVEVEAGHNVPGFESFCDGLGIKDN